MDDTETCTRDLRIGNHVPKGALSPTMMVCACLVAEMCSAWYSTSSSGAVIVDYLACAERGVAKGKKGKEVGSGDIKIESTELASSAQRRYWVRVLLDYFGRDIVHMDCVRSENQNA